MNLRFLLLLTSGTILHGTGASGQSVRLVPSYPNLVLEDNASAAAIVPDGSGRVIAGLQRGLLKILPMASDSTEAPLFLDFRDKLKEEKDFEEGLHGIAFHPDFKNTRRIYLCYSQHAPRRTVLGEFTVPADGGFQADASTGRVVLEYPQPLGNHWGGGIAFGPDGCLYIGIGDGGLRDDPYRLGQNLWSFHGKILRIDVDGRSPGLAYGIPKDNPFIDRQEIRDEIWASGFRNPWGMAFDRSTGNLWCADVGQDRWEEVNLVKPGANHGWSERDGPERFATRGQAPEENGPFAEPFYAYPHSEGISITGGFVYRGKRLPSLSGCYLFADWGMGKIWALPADAKPGETGPPRLVFAKTPDVYPSFNPTVFTADAAGEPLIFSHSPSVVFTLEENRQLAISEEEIAPVQDESTVPVPTSPDPAEEVVPDQEISI